MARVSVIAERLWRERFRGVLAPSAARPAGCVLCLFREADDIDVATALRPRTLTTSTTDGMTT